MVIASESQAQPALTTTVDCMYLLFPHEPGDVCDHKYKHTKRTKVNAADTDKKKK